MRLSEPLSPASLLTQTGRELKPRKLFLLIGLHSAFVINKRRPSNKTMLPWMALRGFSWGGEVEDLFGISDLQANEVGGLREGGFLEDPLKRGKTQCF